MVRQGDQSWNFSVILRVLACVGGVRGSDKSFILTPLAASVRAVALIAVMVTVTTEPSTG